MKGAALVAVLLASGFAICWIARGHDGGGSADSEALVEERVSADEGAARRRPLLGDVSAAAARPLARGGRVLEATRRLRDRQRGAGQPSAPLGEALFVPREERHLEALERIRSLLRGRGAMSDAEAQRVMRVLDDACAEQQALKMAHYGDFARAIEEKGLGNAAAELASIGSIPASELSSGMDAIAAGAALDLFAAAPREKLEAVARDLFGGTFDAACPKPRPPEAYCAQTEKIEPRGCDP